MIQRTGTREYCLDRKIRGDHENLYRYREREFAEIAGHEDPAGRLKAFLLSHFEFDGKTVLEAGAGEGRITDWYLDRVKKAVLTDAYQSMVNVLKRKYQDNDRVTILLCDHRELRNQCQEPFDLFLSAFSFCYAFGPDTEDPGALLEKLLPDCKHHIIVECGGFYEEYDYLRPEKIRYMEALSKRFQKDVIRTEFVFSSPEQAVEAAQTLFPGIAEKVKQKDCAVIPERIAVFYD